MDHKAIHSGHVLGVAALLAPSLGIFGPMLLTPLVLLAMLGMVVLRAVERRGGFRSDRPLFLITGLILGWSALSLIWTIDFGEAAVKCASVVAYGLLAVAALSFGPPMVEHERHALRRFVLAGIALGFFFCFFELATNSGIDRIVFRKEPVVGNMEWALNLAPTVLLVLMWPSVGILWRAWPQAALVLIGLGALAAFLLPSASAGLGYIAGTLVFFAALLKPRGVSLFLAVAVSAGIMLAPFLPRIAPALDPSAIRASSRSHNPSLLHRLDIWAFAIGKIEEHPLIGWGFNTSRRIPGGDAHYELRDRSGKVIGEGNRLPLHTHNGALQVWLELGLPGAIGFAALWALVALRALRQPERAGVACSLAAYATVATIWLLSFGIWQSWWLSLLFLATLLTVSLIAPERS